MSKERKSVKDYRKLNTDVRFKLRRSGTEVTGSANERGITVLFFLHHFSWWFFVSITYCVSIKLVFYLPKHSSFQVPGRAGRRILVREIEHGKVRKPKDVFDRAEDVSV